jgi:hypothetical protein
MEMLNNSFVDTDCPPLAPFGEEVTEVKTDDEETDADCEMEEVTEVETGKVKTRKKRAMNYMEVEHKLDWTRRRARIKPASGIGSASRTGFAS